MKGWQLFFLSSLQICTHNFNLWFKWIPICEIYFRKLECYFNLDRYIFIDIPNFIDLSNLGIFRISYYCFAGSHIYEKWYVYNHFVTIFGQLSHTLIMFLLSHLIFLFLYCFWPIREKKVVTKWLSKYHYYIAIVCRQHALGLLS